MTAPPITFIKRSAKILLELKNLSIEIWDDSPSFHEPKSQCLLKCGNLLSFPTIHAAGRLFQWRKYMKPMLSDSTQDSPKYYLHWLIYNIHYTILAKIQLYTNNNWKGGHHETCFLIDINIASCEEDHQPVTALDFTIR